jgi:curved DNA-binding protein CbpA
MNKNLYDILGLSKNATFEEIKAKYKSLAQQHHPDKGGDPELFKEIKNAYEVLSDPVNRKKYDTTGHYESGTSLRDQALEQLSRLFFNLLPNINPDLDDLILIMKNESRREKLNINNNINMCNGYIFRLKKIIKKIKKKNDQGENLLKMFAENQLKNHENELENFIRQIQIVDMVIEMLEDYQYGDVATLIENFMNPSPEQV